MNKKTSRELTALELTYFFCLRQKSFQAHLTAEKYFKMSSELHNLRDFSSYDIFVRESLVSVKRERFSIDLLALSALVSAQLHHPQSVIHFHPLTSEGKNSTQVLINFPQFLDPREFICTTKSKRQNLCQQHRYFSIHRFNDVFRCGTPKRSGETRMEWIKRQHSDICENLLRFT